jgi:hypothetical protein
MLTGQLKEKPTYRVWCLYSSFVHALTTGLDLVHRIIKMTTCPLISFLYFLYVSRSESKRGGDTGHGQHSRQGPLPQPVISFTNIQISYDSLYFVR